MTGPIVGESLEIGDRQETVQGGQGGECARSNPRWFQSLVQDCGLV